MGRRAQGRKREREQELERCLQERGWEKEKGGRERGGGRRKEEQRRNRAAEESNSRGGESDAQRPEEGEGRVGPLQSGVPTGLAPSRPNPSWAKSGSTAASGDPGELFEHSGCPLCSQGTEEQQGGGGCHGGDPGKDTDALGAEDTGQSSPRDSNPTDDGVQVTSRGDSSPFPSLFHHYLPKIFLTSYKFQHGTW